MEQNSKYNRADIEEPKNIVPRTPMLCAGCPHRPIFHILKMAMAVVIGDIGCYSLGILEPFEVHKTNISMGASLGIALGVAKTHSRIGIKKPLVATIGDGAFFHSGMTGFVQLAQCKENITVIVMDNRTTAMKRENLSVIVTTRPCALNFKVKEPHYFVDENICISCRNCIRTNCPPISMKFYDGKDKKNSYINPDMCVVCSVCSQVCPVGAIKKSADK